MRAWKEDRKETGALVVGESVCECVGCCAHAQTRMHEHRDVHTETHTHSLINIAACEVWSSRKRRGSAHESPWR